MLIPLKKMEGWDICGEVGTPADDCFTSFPQHLKIGHYKFAFAALCEFVITHDTNHELTERAPREGQ